MDIEITDGIVLGRAGNRALLGKLYYPEPTGQALPAILWIHGGAWLRNDRHSESDWCVALAANGYVCLTLDYRLSPEAIFPAAIHDCKCAIRYLRANAAELGIDPQRIGAWGTSAGAHLAALLGTSAGVPELEGEGGWAGTSSAVQAVCDWYGPSDFMHMGDYPDQIDLDHNAPDSPESLLIGAPILEHPDLVAKANPITYISPQTPPIFIAHGKRDRIVPYNQSERLYAALVAWGLQTVFHTLEEAGHGGANFEPDGPLFARCVEFFKQHLKREAAAQH